MASGVSTRQNLPRQNLPGLVTDLAFIRNHLTFGATELRLLGWLTPWHLVVPARARPTKINLKFEALVGRLGQAPFLVTPGPAADPAALTAPRQFLIPGSWPLAYEYSGR